MDKRSNGISINYLFTLGWHLRVIFLFLHKNCFLPKFLTVRMIPRICQGASMTGDDGDMTSIRPVTAAVATTTTMDQLFGLLTFAPVFL